MFNGNLLKAKIVEKGKNVIDVANAIGICEATFYRKISNDGSFSRLEIKNISQFLALTDDERNNIFFA